MYKQTTPCLHLCCGIIVQMKNKNNNNNNNDDFLGKNITPIADRSMNSIIRLLQKYREQNIARALSSSYNN